MCLHTTNAQPPYLLAPSEQQRQSQEQDSILQISQQLTVTFGELFGWSGQKLLPSLAGKYEFATADGASLIDESTHLE